MTITYEAALDLIKVSVPAHLEAQAEVPILTGVPQRQGDLLIVPVPSEDVDYLRSSRQWKPAPVQAGGVQVVHGENTGNTHWLHNNIGSQVKWQRGRGQILGWVVVPKNQSALLIHTDEHGANGIGEGIYEIRRRNQVTDMGTTAPSYD